MGKHDNLLLIGAGVVGLALISGKAPEPIQQATQGVRGAFESIKDRVENVSNVEKIISNNIVERVTEIRDKVSGSSGGLFEGIANRIPGTSSGSVKMPTPGTITQRAITASANIGQGANVFQKFADETGAAINKAMINPSTRVGTLGAIALTPGAALLSTAGTLSQGVAIVGKAIQSITSSLFGRR